MTEDMSAADCKRAQALGHGAGRACSLSVLLHGLLCAILCPQVCQGQLPSISSCQHVLHNGNYIFVHVCNATRRIDSVETIILQRLKFRRNLALQV
jgi:hypothetical protein